MTSGLSPDASDGAEPRLAERDLTSGAGAARDSLTMGAWTMVSRVTGVARVLSIGAILGPTALGNTYQLTNGIPNLVYYGFLAGSLFSSLLVPTLVAHMDGPDSTGPGRVAGGFLGVALLALGIVAPFVVLLLPHILSLTGIGASHVDVREQVHLAGLLGVMVMPQVLGYAVIGTSAATMNARHRFALTAAAPAIENVAIIAILLLFRLYFGAGEGGDSTSSGGLLLLGLGSTAAVGIHATLQWWGAYRCGVSLRPRAGWSDPEVRSIIRRSLPALAQSGLVALQVLTLLLVASRVPGGTIAMQIALNFYALPIALAATPVALALLPRLSRLYQSDRGAEFHDTYVRGLRLALFMTIPAACGYLALAGYIAHTVAVGRMDTTAGVSMVSWALAAVAVGLLGQSTFFLATQAAYSTGDTHTPLVAMVAQAGVCLCLCACALRLDGEAVVGVAGASYSVANLVGATLLLVRLRRRFPAGRERLRGSLLRTAVASVAMTGPTALVANLVNESTPGEVGWASALAAAGVVGLAVFIGVAALLRSPELSWLRGGMLGSVPARPVTETSS